MRNAWPNTLPRFQSGIDLAVELQNGVNVCDLSFDEFGKHAIGLINIDDVHKFCRVTLAVIDDLPTGVNIIDGLPKSLK
jgi:hypothetical protein